MNSYPRKGDMDIRRLHEAWSKAQRLAGREAACRRFCVDDIKIKVDWNPDSDGFDFEFVGIENFINMLCRRGLPEEIQKAFDLMFRSRHYDRINWRSKVNSDCTRSGWMEYDEDKDRATWVTIGCGTHKIFGKVVSVKEWSHHYWQDSKLVEYNWISRVSNPCDIGANN